MIANSTETIEPLPFPHVIYPPLYGVFIHFKPTQDAEQAFLCACQAQAYRRFQWTCSSSVEEIPDSLFKENLCHLCQQRVPYIRYCHAQYVNRFNYYFGWYVLSRQWHYSLRNPSVVKPASYTIDTEKTQKQDIENEVRQQLGFPLVSSRRGKLKERLLYLIIAERFSQFTVQSGVRLPELDGLEIDVYVVELKLGFEYQGEQHYKPVKHWGGEAGLKDLKKRDRKKKQLCKKQGIKLMTIHYRKEISHLLLDDLLAQAEISPERHF